MKRLIITIMAAFCAICQSQAIDFSDDRGITVSALFGVSHSHRSFNHHSDNHYGLVASPRIGYKFNADWEAGALFRYEKFKDYNEYVGVGIYGEWSFMRFASELRLITEAHATFNAYDSNGYLINGYNNTYPYKHTDMTEVGFTPCIAYRIAIVR